MIRQLELIRKSIDNIDNKIFDLISLRLKKILKISEIKNILKIPSYIKERENDLIFNKIINNKRNNISDSLINDILKRIMYESYNIENKKIVLKNYKKYKILFIGNNMEIEKIFKNLFLNSGYSIYEINFENFNNEFYKIIKKINTIIICVKNIFQFKKILNLIINYININHILINISIDMEISTELMLKKNISILNICPMFEKNIISVTKQTIIICEIKNDYKYEWIIKQFILWGIEIKKIDYKLYNKYIFYTNTLKKILLITYYELLYKNNINFQKLMNYSSNINKIFLLNIEQLIINNINIDIKNIFFNKENILIINKFIKNLKITLNNFSSKKEKKIIKYFIYIKKLIKFKIDYISKTNKLLTNNINIYK